MGVAGIKAGDLDPLSVVDEPLDESVTQAEAESQAVREEESVGAAEAARRTDRSRQSIERLRRAGRLLGLRVGAQWRYPLWQFSSDTPGGIVPGLGEVLGALALSPAGAGFWLLKPAERLGGQAPIDLLRQFRPDPVIELAREHSFLP